MATALHHKHVYTVGHSLPLELHATGMQRLYVAHHKQRSAQADSAEQWAEPYVNQPAPGPRQEHEQLHSNATMHYTMLR